MSQYPSAYAEPEKERTDEQGSIQYGLSIKSIGWMPWH